MDTAKLTACSDNVGDTDATTAGRGGGLAEDSRVPNIEGAVCVATNRKMLTALVAGYEMDPMTRDPAVDPCVFILSVVVETTRFDTEVETVYRENPKNTSLCSESDKTDEET